MLAGSAAAQDTDANGVALPTIEVTGEQGGGYQAINPALTRIPTPLIDTPQTVNVVTQQVIQEQRQLTMEDALRYIPGITFSAGEGAQQGDGPIIRGFVARGDLFRDGIRDPGWYTRDLFSADRVEVYKGPSAFAFGRGATGGAINTVSKLPNGNTFVEGVVTATTGPGTRFDLDAGTKVGNVSARIAALYQDIDTPTRDNIWTKRWGVAPSVSIDVSDKTKITASYVYQGEEGPSDYGFTYLPQPAYSPLTGALTNPGYYGNGAPTPPLPVNRSNWFGIPLGPLRDITTTETHIGTLKLDHELADGLKISNTSRYIDNDRFARVTAPRNIGNAANQIFATGTTAGLASYGYPTDLMTLGRERRERDTANTYLVNQTDLTAKFNTGSFAHTVAAGVEFSRETRDQTRRDICDSSNPLCRTSIANPDPNGSPVGGATINYIPITTEASNVAAYISDQIKINQYLEILTSARGDRFSTEYRDPNQALPQNRNLARTDNMFSYRLGAVVHPTTNSSVYVAYGNSYNPSAEQGTITNASVASLAPEKTFSVEAGVKVDVLDRRLSLTGAVFRIEKTNLRITEPTDNTVSTLDGIARVDGIELGVVGKITDQWSVFAGYSYLHSEVMKDKNLNELGRELPNTPPHNFTLWTTYAVTPELTIGGGATYQAMAFANIGNTAYVPDYWKFDAMVSYKVDKNSTLQFNIYNITDELYYAQYFGANVVPASGRWASLSLRVRY